jgi:hypothetical protein
MSFYLLESRSGDRECVPKIPLMTSESLSPLRGSVELGSLTQGSQSLTLGLTLIAAPQLGTELMRVY